MVPPPLAWIPSFCASTGFPLDQAMVAEVFPTVNPLTYKIRVRWGEPISSKSALLVWNLFQIWAARNGTVVENGKMTFDVRGDDYYGMSVQAILRERLGLPRDECP